MATFRVTFKGKDSQQIMLLEATDRDDAKQQAERAHYRRQERFPLTFSRLEEARETGKPGLLAIDPRLGGQALTKAWVDGETELRKRDHARYESGDLKIAKIEEVK